MERKYPNLCRPIGKVRLGSLFCPAQNLFNLFLLTVGFLIYTNFSGLPSTIMDLPYLASVAEAQVGDTVTIEWVYGPSNAVVIK